MAATTNARANIAEAILWHQRFGHSSSTLHLPFYVNHKLGLKTFIVCSIAKQSRNSFSTSLSRMKQLFALVHLELWGPYNIPTMNVIKILLQ